MQRLIIGTYPTGDTAGTGEGLWEVALDRATGALSGQRQLLETPSPSFLALDPGGQTLFAVAELADGVLTSFALDGDELVQGESLPTGGADPCHVVAREDAVWVANYSSGTFSVLGLDRGEDGTGAPRLTGEVATFDHAGSGPDAGRQEGPHAHFSLASPDGEHAWVVDLGTDAVRRYRLRPAGTSASTGTSPSTGSSVSSSGPLASGDGLAATFPPGTGPRHAVVHPGGAVAFVVGELDSQVHVLRLDAATGTGEPVASVPACRTPDPGTGSFPSHVALSADGTRLYVAVRGPDVLASFAITGEGTDVGLTHLADTPVGGVWPRHFAVLAGVAGPGEGAADLVVVANQTSSDLAVLRVDAQTGRGELVAQTALPAPACVLEV